MIVAHLVFPTDLNWGTPSTQENLAILTPEDNKSGPDLAVGGPWAQPYVEPPEALSFAQKLSIT